MHAKEIYMKNTVYTIYLSKQILIHQSIKVKKLETKRISPIR